MYSMDYNMALNCGVTFAGIKPASLMRIKQSELETMDYYRRCFACKHFEIDILKTDEQGALVYVYNRPRLYELLESSEIKEFLLQEGYAYDNAEQAIVQLKERLTNNETFPHEIGVFLGYPLEDVKGFISDPRNGVMLSGYWKVYANVEEKQQLFCRYGTCSRCICNKIMDGKTLTEIFNVA